MRERLLGAGGKVTTYSTPRRLAVLVEDVLASQADTEEKLTGPYTIRTEWIDRGTKLVSTISFRTKDRCDAELSVVRELADEGKTLLLTQTLKVSGESEPWIVRRVWRKR